MLRCSAMDNLISLPSAARELNISSQRVYQLAKDGLLKTVSVMDRKAVKRTELERFKKLDRPAHRPRVAAKRDGK